MIRAALIVMVAMLSGCLTNRAHDSVLEPAVVAAWPEVRADAELGGLGESTLANWDMAMETLNFLGLDSQELRDAAIAGVDQLLIRDEIGPNGADIMRGTVESFVAAIEELRRGVLASRERTTSDRPLVISRSSWATNPPPAIAARTYR